MPNQYTHPWTPQEIKFLEHNVKKLTYKQMSKFIDRTPFSIQSKIRYLPFQAKIKKHQINSNFFKTPSSKVAYVLGLIAADGNICHTGRAHVLHLASDDKDIIQKIKSLMNYSGPIHEKKRSNGKISYSLRVCDQAIFNDLQKLGITERKSLTLQPPKLNKTLVSHFIRGYFDGDGSVFALHNPKYPSHNLGVHLYTASFAMAKYLYTVLKNLLGTSYKGKIKSYLAHQKTNYYVLSLGAGPSKKLFEYMYKNSDSLYINRKYNRFMRGIKHVT